MSASILADWHVACQLGLQPREMRTFLLTVEALRRPSSGDGTSVLRALEEVCRLERWAHVYVLPTVCRELRRRGSQGVRESFVDPVIAGGRPELAESLGSVIDGLTENEDAHLLLARLERVAASVRGDEFDLGLGRATGGYLELEEYDLSTLLLSVALALAEEAPADVASVFGRGQGEAEVTTALATFLFRVLNGEQGRFCALIGCDLAMAVPELASREDLTDSLLRFAPRGMAQAPDLLYRAALLEFGRPAPDVDARRRQLDLLNRELRTFEHWQSIAGDLLAPAARSEIVQMSLMFWQDVLWQVMADIDPQEAAARLQQVWLPPIFELSQGYETIATPIAQSRLQTTNYLHKLIGAHGSTRPRFRSAAADKNSPYWWSLSPWLAVSPPRSQHPTSDSALRGGGGVRIETLASCRSSGRNRCALAVVPRPSPARAPRTWPVQILGLRRTANGHQRAESICPRTRLPKDHRKGCRRACTSSGTVTLRGIA